MDDKPTTQPDPRANYQCLLDQSATHELGQMFIQAVQIGDTEFAAALREEIKHRKPETLSTKEAARRLGVSTITVIRLWKDGRLEGHKQDPEKRNSPIKITAESVQKLINERSHK